MSTLLTTPHHFNSITQIHVQGAEIRLMTKGSEPHKTSTYTWEGGGRDENRPTSMLSHGSFLNTSCRCTRPWAPLTRHWAIGLSQTAQARTELQSTSMKGLLGRAVKVVICRENFNQSGFCPYVLQEISVHDEPDLGCLRYSYRCVVVP